MAYKKESEVDTLICCCDDGYYVEILLNGVLVDEAGPFECWGDAEWAELRISE
jgi:hypothetical protein